MWPFKRRNQTDGTIPEVPAEIQEYYEAERRERTGIAWLIALGTLVVTLLIAVGLFFGGRWVYRKIAHRKSPSTVATTNTSKPADTSKSTDNKNNNQSATTPTNTTNNTSQTTPSTTSNSSNSSTGTSGSTTPQASTGSSSSSGTSSSNTSSTSGSSTEAGKSGGSGSGSTTPTTRLPGTGPADTLGAFLATTVAGTLVYEIRSYRRQNKLR